jgi:hypothetical protein
MTTGTAQAEATIVGIDGAPGLGFYRLLVRLDIGLYPGGNNQTATLIPYGGELLVHAADGRQYHVGRLGPMGNNYLVEAINIKANQQVWFSVELDRTRLQAIEEIRAGGDLFFVLNLFVLLQWGAERFKYHQQVTPPSHRVNLKTWAEMREQMGAGRTVLIEVPEPDASRFPALVEPIKHWNEAWQAWFRSDYHDTIAKCRLTVESLSHTLGDATGPSFKTLLKAFADDQKAMDKTARMQLVRRALENLCHPPHHADPAAAQIKWTRNDAEFALTACSGLLHLYAAEGG